MRRVSAYQTTHDNGDTFTVVYDYASGRKNVYTVFKHRTGQAARIIGREIPGLRKCRCLIERHR